ncbi:DNA-binding HxlR family transcriptional regulator/putative sterol carrier protein [Nocardia sp. GAS34]|uniref:winged helix-turn-helix transcriptional regulator n=1 Tax=unclassified Nocardia TaxID=2637762 RepID=UPI003D1BCFD8
MSRGYLQFCGLARAMEMVGGRWALLIVRELLDGPRRFTDLQKGLPGIPTNVLSARLKELEELDIATRRLLGRSVAYELTDYGRELDSAMVTLGMWGARRLGTRGPDDFFSVHSLSLALRGAFRADPGDPDYLFELRIGEDELLVSISHGTLSFPAEGDHRPDATIETDADTIFQILNGTTDLDEAIATGLAGVTGNLRAAKRFVDLFRMPQPVDAVAGAAQTS